MQIHSDHAADACHAEHIGHQFGSYTHTGLALAVLSCPSKIRNHSCYSLGRGSLGCVYHEQEFHEIVCIGECALYQEYILSADTFLKTNFKLTICKASNGKIAQFTIQTLANLLSQITAVGSREHLECLLLFHIFIY